MHLLVCDSPPKLVNQRRYQGANYDRQPETERGDNQHAECGLDRKQDPGKGDFQRLR
jgi:hypothetical protein